MNVSENDQEKIKLICPPQEVSGMKTLNKDLFRKEVKLPYILTTTAQISKVSKPLKPYFFRVDCFKPMVDYPDLPDCHQIFLNPDMFNEDVMNIIEDLQPDLVQLPNYVDNCYFGYQTHELTYDNFGFHSIFRAILPKDVEIISGFSNIGHILHLNLRDDTLPYKQIIGQV